MEAAVIWRKRMIEFLRKECERMNTQIDALSSGKRQLWEMSEGKRRDITDEQITILRSHQAECERILNEEEYS